MRPAFLLSGSLPGAAPGRLNNAPEFLRLVGHSTRQDYYGPRIFLPQPVGRDRWARREERTAQRSVPTIRLLREIQ